MPLPPPQDAPRCAVVDLGSNSVRLVVYEGHNRNPVSIFNEKAAPRLGKGLQKTGRLSDEAISQALTLVHRYRAVAHAMDVRKLEVLATAAVRDAENGPAFVESVRDLLPGVPVRVLSGAEEAELSALGVLCGIPDAHGVLADIGGGSLELVRLSKGQVEDGAQTLPLGVIRLAERSGGDLSTASELAGADLETVPWLGQGEGKGLYLSGGAWRALARLHMAETAYPLHMVHHYSIGRDEAKALAMMVAGASRRALERMPVPRKRIDDLPFAAIVLRRLLRATGAARVVFSASGLREGWYMRQLSEEIRAQDPLISTGQDYARRLGRDPDFPPHLIAWTAPLFPKENPVQRRLREALCWMSDLASRDHPEYKPEQAFWRVLRQPGIALDHPARGFLALAVAIRYDMPPEAEVLRPARRLLDVASARRAEILGAALGLAYTLSAGTPDLLAATSLRPEGRMLVLSLCRRAGVFAGDSIVRRLERLAEAMGLQGSVEAG